jgi:hypothetical protein
MRKDITSTLKGALLNHQLVALHLDPSNMSLCLMGYVDAIDNTLVRLRIVSSEGKSAGYGIRFIREIYRVDVDTFYLKKIEFLYQNRDNNIFSEVELITPNSDILFSTFRKAKDKRVIVVLWTEDEDDSIIGYVESITPKTVQILSIDDYGQEEGFIVINISEIVAVNCNGRKEQILRFLHEKNFEN